MTAITKNLGYDEILDSIKKHDPRINLLKARYYAIYANRDISKDCDILHKLDGKYYLINFDDKLDKSVIIRDLVKRRRLLTHSHIIIINTNSVCKSTFEVKISEVANIPFI
ncbi:MAG: hypothetical protein K2P17_02570 [Helicobacteraceae bacterium]|nr:hypothetical protein [Helicobacteraceae bacterium]